jgi:hypothetical protein
MRKVFLLILLLFVPLGAAKAQNDPKFDVFGGYSFISTDLLETPGVVPGMRDGFHGWNAAFTWYASHNVGFTADFSGSYGSQMVPAYYDGVTGETKVHLHSFAFGPKLVHHADKFEMFAHGLFGFQRASLEVPPALVDGAGSNPTNTDFGMVLGGGLDYVVRKKCAIRVMQVDYMMGQLFGSIENHVRLSTGLIFRLPK